MYIWLIDLDSDSDKLENSNSAMLYINTVAPKRESKSVVLFPSWCDVCVCNDVVTRS